MTLQIINNAFENDEYSLFVDSRKMHDKECIECENGHFPVRIKIVENNLFNGTKVKFSHMQKMLMSLYLYGGYNYYAPYHTITECTVVPAECPALIIERSGTDILIKDRDGLPVQSKCRIEMSKKNFWRSVLLSVFRFALLFLAYGYALYVIGIINEFESKFRFYCDIAFITLVLLFLLWDVFSVLFRSLRYLKNTNE